MARLEQEALGARFRMGVTIDLTDEGLVTKHCMRNNGR
jgi:hypothetical protein